jgi:hypothetical protein
MSFYPWADFLKFAAPRRRSPTRGACRRPTRIRPFLEALEDRSVPSVVDPLPIPGGALVPNPFGGPDGHFHQPGPADSANPNKVGGDPSSIYNFNGFVAEVRVDGTGTDNNGNTLLWEVDLRFMDGVYQGVDGNIHHGAFALI